ncbi:MAG: SusC/RagA family TonB-linked outer membrane protein [Prevotellaceae bacterium]|jgi:TonB-linked SusC/RagA family outer membrane protein|nr:SusC/RagA family TonB-linked outer membrane protein [Prevotellaceae bacterium]
MENKKQWKLSTITSNAFGAFRFPAVKSFLFIMLALTWCSAAYAQKTAQGQVVDEAGEAVIGASVLIKGSTYGTFSDVNGYFSLTNVENNSEIEISYLGYHTQRITFTGQETLNVILVEDTKSLDEVVVIGYGSQTKKELTGAITSLKTDDFNQGIVANPMGLIQGKVAGLVVIKNGGDDPAQNSYKIQLRGVGSIKGSAEPLYVIDGVPGGNISSVLPGDIESIDVLKDGSAAAIYGTRANAGVVLITTKRGKMGQGSPVSDVEYNGSVSVGIMAKKPRILTADEYRTYMVDKEMGIDYGASTDWISAITRTPVSHSHAVSMSGSASKFSYRTSFSYRKVEGIALKSDYEELNGRFAANQKALNGMLDVAYDLAYTSGNKSWANYDNFLQAVRTNPTMPIYSNEAEYVKYGGYFESDGFYSRNPVADINMTDNDQKDKTLQGSVRANLNLFSFLKFSTFYSLQENGAWNGKYQASTLRDVYGKGGVASQSQSNNRSQVVENTLQYMERFGKSDVQLLLGQAYQYNVYQSFSAANTLFTVDKLSYNNLGNGQGLKNIAELGNSAASVSSSKYSDKLASFFARALYNFDQKYFFNASVRMEGSSKFGKKADPTLGPWGIFPAVSASWVVDREDFMQGVAFVNDLKLRAGYGVTGNMPGDSYLYAMRLGQGSSQIFVDGNWIVPFNIVSNLNEHIRWEKKHEYNVGVDFAVLNSRIYGAIDGYFRNTTDLLYEYNVPSPPNPVGTMWDNYGQIHNYGVELALNGRVVKATELTLDVGLTAAVNRNKVVRLSSGYSQDAENPSYLNTGYISSGDGETGSYVMRLEEGKPIGNFYGWKYYGINKSGEWVFTTPSGGYTTNPQESDRIILGNAQPDVTYGFNAALKYKTLDVALNFRGQIGGLIFNETRYFFENTRNVENALLSAVEGEAALLTAWKTSGESNASIRRFSDFYLEDGSYLKLSDVTVGYTPKLSGEISSYIHSLRVYFTAQNVFTLTGYSGVDPEIAPKDGDSLQPGFDTRSFYPRQRTFNLGISLKF